MRRFVAGLSLGLLGLAFGRPAPALGKSTVVDALLDDQDATIYVDPMLTSAPMPARENWPHVGDVNGDGVPDLVVTQRTAAWNGDQLRGLIWILYGPIPDGETDLSVRPPDVLFVGAGSGQILGFSVAVADFNGDGTDDIAAFARGGDPRCTGPCNSSVVYLYFGGALPAFIDPTQTIADVTIIGGTQRAVQRVNSADVDGDGIADLLLLAETSGAPPRSSGILYGRAAWPPVIDLFTSAWDTEFPDVPGGCQCGCDTREMTAGDVNGDGHPDLLVADPTTRTSEELGGELMIWFGSGGRFPASLPRATADVVIYGETPRAEIGSRIAVGDFDGDGIDDIALAAPSVTAPWTSGDAFVFYGRSIWPSLIGANTEYDLALRVSPAGVNLDCRLELADFDGDGRSDLALSNYDFAPDLTRTWAGRAVLFLGLPRITGDMSFDDYPRSLQLWAADRGDLLGVETGLLLSDLDRDGRADLLATASFGAGPNNVHAATSPGDMLLVRGCDWPTCCDLWRDDSIRVISPLDRPLSSLLPLDGDDCHRWRHVSGEADRDTAVLADLSRPLVLYASPRTTNDLFLTRGPGDRVHVHY